MLNLLVLLLQKLTLKNKNMLKINLLLAILILFTNCSAQNYEKLLLNDNKTLIRNNTYSNGHAGVYSSFIVRYDYLSSSFKVDSLYRLTSFYLHDSIVSIKGEIKYDTSWNTIAYVFITDKKQSKNTETCVISINNNKIVKGLLSSRGQFLGKWTQYNEVSKKEEGSILFVDKIGKGTTEVIDKFEISSYFKSKEGKTNFIENFLKYGDILGVEK